MSDIQNAVRAYEEGDWSAARNICMAILESSAPNLDALNILAILDIKEGHSDSAIERLNKAIKISGGNSTYFTNLARALSRTGDFSDAVSAFLKAIISSPKYDRSSLFYEMSTALEQSGADTEAQFFRILGNSPGIQNKEISTGSTRSLTDLSPLKFNGIRRSDDFGLGKVSSKAFQLPAEDEARRVVHVSQQFARECLVQLDPIIEELVRLPEISRDIDVIRNIEKSAVFSSGYYFIVSTGRCGTHAVQNLFERSSLVNPIHNTRFNISSDRRNEIFYAQMHKMFDHDYLASVLKDVVQQITLDLSAAVQDGRNCVVTSHGHTVYTPFIKHLLPQSKFIFLHRNPYDVFLSLYTKACYVGQIEPLEIDVTNFYREFRIRGPDMGPASKDCVGIFMPHIHIALRLAKSWAQIDTLTFYPMHYFSSKTLSF